MTTFSDRPDTAPGTRPVVATACGKIILLGEHAVVYGEPAVAVPLRAWRLSVVLSQPERWVMGEPAGQPSLDETIPTGLDAVMPRVRPDPNAPTADFGEDPPLDVDLSDDAPAGSRRDVARALAAAAANLGVTLPVPLRVAVRSGGLRSGLGTSAALGTACARALLVWEGEEPDDERVLQAAAAVEQLFHSSPSGIDHTVSVTEQPVWFVKGRPAEALTGLPPLTLVLLPRRSSRSTAELVDGVRDRLVGDPTLVRTVAELGRWTREGLAAWRDGDLVALGEAMTAQGRGLDRLGVVEEGDREAVHAALAAGARGAKITGAGGGGSLIALVADDGAAVRDAWGPDAVTLTLS